MNAAAHRIIESGNVAVHRPSKALSAAAIGTRNLHGAGVHKLVEQP